MAKVFGIKSKIIIVWKKYLYMENIQKQKLTFNSCLVWMLWETQALFPAEH